MKLWALGLLVIGMLAGCGGPTETASAGGTTKPGAEARLRIAMVPSEDAEKMLEGFEPIRAQMEKDIGRKVEMTKVTDYGSVIEAMRAGKVDIAWYGPLSMVLANQEAGAVPFIAADIEGKGLTYHSLIVVRADAGIATVKDLAGKKMAFVDPGSTSGNLVPRSMLMKEFGKKAEDVLAEVTYAGSHDASLLALTNGSVDACAVQDITWDDMVAKNQVDTAKYRVLVTSGPLPPSPFGYRKDLDEATVKAVTDSFVGMKDKGVPMDVAGFGKLKGFVPVTMKDYETVVTMSETLGLTPEQMSK